MDNQGRTVKSFNEHLSGKNIEQHYHLDLKDISPGIYMMKVTEGMKCVSKKIIKSE